MDDITNELDLSNKMRVYLAHIYRLANRATDEDGFISTSALADLLDVSAPAVNRMINKLREMDMLAHEPYQGIKLTEMGRREALKQLRYQRIVEVFLVKVMQFEWDEVYEEAQRMSDAMSEALIQRMLDMTGQPTFCPHGEPIPKADGTLNELDDMLLSIAEPNHKYTITRVLTREADRLQYIAALHLLPGALIEVLHIAPFNGPLQLKLGTEYRIIGHNLAELIRVQKA